MFNGLQWWHVLIVVLVFVLLFGGKKLPDAARGLGRSLRILKAEVGEIATGQPVTIVPTALPAVTVDPIPPAQPVPKAQPVPQAQPINPTQITVEGRPADGR